MAAGRLFPSVVQSLVREGKKLAFAIAPNGTGTPTLVSGASQGVKSVSRTAAGAFTVTLQDSYPSLVDGQASVQLAAAPATTAASYTWTDTTDTNSVTFQAGASAPGPLGNNLKVVVATGSALATSVAYSAGVTTVTFTIDTTVTTPALLTTYVNTTAPNGLITISAHSGTTAFTVFLAAAALTGGASTGGLAVQFGAIDVVSAQTVKLQVVSTITGSGADIASAAGNQINVELFLKNSP